MIRPSISLKHFFLFSSFLVKLARIHYASDYNFSFIWTIITYYKFFNLKNHKNPSVYGFQLRTPHSLKSICWPDLCIAVPLLRLTKAVNWISNPFLWAFIFSNNFPQLSDSEHYSGKALIESILKRSRT